jgi:hypothetical protein
MGNEISWHGTQQDSFDLMNALARNCTCEFGLMGKRLTTCGVHRMLVEDQRALNGLLFVRSMVERLLREEFSTEEGVLTDPSVPGLHTPQTASLR